MLTSNKKRKLQHGLDTAPKAAKPARADGKSPVNLDSRFQMDSDFSESDDEHGHDAPKTAGRGPRPLLSMAATPSARTAATPATAKTARKQASKRTPAPEKQTEATGDDGKLAGDDTAVQDGKTDGGAGAGPRSGDAEDRDPDQQQALGAAPGGDTSGAADGAGEEGTSGSGEEGASGSGDEGQEQQPQQQEEEGQQRKAKKVLSKRKLERVKEASDRRGIVYVSRIPPHMKPHKLRQLLEPFGELGRVYCAPEDPSLRRMRKKKGGNSGKNFTEGWVEFEDKRRAKRAALALNGQPMGGSKRSAYHYDLWTIKYLPKFKWDTLTEEINYQRAVREQRLVAEISAAKRERDFYLSRVDKAKAIDAIQERRAKKEQQQQQQPGATGGDGAQPDSSAPQRQQPAEQNGAGAAAAADKGKAGGGKGPRFERHFGQRRAKADPVLDDRAPVLADDLLGLLGRRK
ncbi:hypothetical protein Agub_g13359 [Astrephomene gubernaculifera]|uniref:RRM domain-containing protein n=1 Tax=Astrephomene gubernaculifera TaxID=47775 RepID=A0AAD3E432_9CHLO|nr:hypothetical protein Agub_g13359 [Astrephomene gubernaculifera]